MRIRIPILLLGILGPTSTAASAQAESSSTHLWSEIDSARTGATRCEGIAARLEQRLRRLPEAELEQFALEWSGWWRDTYTWDLWGAAYIINGGASDDGFEYFRGWLLSEGSKRWRRVNRDIESAFDDLRPGSPVECEDIIYTLPAVYRERIGKEPPSPRLDQPSGEPWTEEAVSARFPRLSRRFGP
jgi:Protein of unknown function (DUF4240)